ncbi:MAG TPA: hypothetical protein VL418_11610 [Devosiaceae bacterium]|nr:hypothetical protein [Devosiaceae bacterium]
MTGASTAGGTGGVGSLLGAFPGGVSGLIPGVGVGTEGPSFRPCSNTIATGEGGGSSSGASSRRIVGSSNAKIST